MHNDVMKRIVNYKTFLNESSGASKLTAEQINFLNKYVKGKWHLNDEGFVDVDGDFNCSSKGISDFKGIKFGNVDRHFNCAYNKLTSLEGGPEKVGGYFNCSFNNLTSLVFGPERVEDHFTCSDNNIITLEGSPKKINRSFNCSRNKLTSLEGAPKEVGGDFYFVRNEGVSSEILKVIFRKMLEDKSDYKTSLKSLWEEIPIDDKILLYTPDLDWIEGDEAAKLSKLKKYSNIKQMI